MRYGIIDVGSNTIRLVIYEKRGEKFIQVKNIADYAGLLSHVEQGNITDEGRTKLAGTLSDMRKICETYECDRIYAFATASLRDIEQKAAFCAWIKEKTGVSMDIISGLQEAEFDYKGLMREYHVRRGAAFDLGGGSCQLTCFEFGRIVEYDSMKIGSLRMYNQFVRGTLPTEKECHIIKMEVRRALAGFGILKNAGFETIYAMGGAARAALEMRKRFSEKQRPILTLKEMEELCHLPEKVIMELIPQRLTTIIPALITVMEICDHIGAKQIQVVDCGVREGILAEIAGIENDI